MRLTVNGAERTVGEGATLAEVVAATTAQGRGLAVAVNGEVVPRLGWPARVLRDGDRVEVLTAAQGG